MMGVMADMAVPDEIIEARDGRPEIIIRRSARRRRTLSARMEGSSVLVMVPMGMRKADQDRQVMELVDKVTKSDARRRHHDSNDELTRRAPSVVPEVSRSACQRHGRAGVGAVGVQSEQPLGFMHAVDRSD